LLGTFTTGDFPNDVLFDGANIWVVSFLDGTIAKLRPSDGALLGKRIVGNSLHGLAFDGNDV